jgi:hypothetical protein
MLILGCARAKAISQGCHLLTKAAHAVKTERCPPTAYPHYGKALRAFDRVLIPPWSAAGNEIANSGARSRKDQT